MPSPRTKRVLFIVGLLFLVVFVGALVGAYMISRDPGFAFENPKKFETDRFVTKLGKYENAVTNQQKGFVRFSQAEINSYIQQSMTNRPETNAGGLQLRRGRVVRGHPSGTAQDVQDTMEFSALNGIRPMTEVVPLERADEAYRRMLSGAARFRMVLTTG